MGIFVRRGEIKNLLFCKFVIVSLYEKKVLIQNDLTIVMGTTYHCMKGFFIILDICRLLIGSTILQTDYFSNVLYTYSSPCISERSIHMHFSLLGFLKPFV